MKNQMLTIRKVPASVYLELDQYANKLNMSREEYIRQLLETHVQSEKLKRHNSEVDERLDLNTLALEKNNELLRQIWLKLDSMKE